MVPTPHVLPPLLSGSDGFLSRMHHTRQDERQVFLALALRVL